MRTHIRMHIDRKAGDVNEENYISCILDDDSTEIPPAAAVNKNPSPISSETKVVKHGKVSKSPEVAEETITRNGTSEAAIEARLDCTILNFISKF